MKRYVIFFLMAFMLVCGCDSTPPDEYMEVSKDTEATAVSYPQNTTPDRSDEAVGINAPDGVWAINRFPFSDILGLITESDIPSEIARDSELPTGFIENPMTTLNDILYGGTSGLPTRLAAQANSFAGWDSDGDFDAYDSFSLGDDGYQIFDSDNSSVRARFYFGSGATEQTYDYLFPTAEGTLALEGVESTVISANTTLTAAQCLGKRYFINTDEVQITLAPVAEMYDLEICKIGAIDAYVAPDEDDTLWLNGDALNDGDKLKSPNTTTGGCVHLSSLSANGYYAKAESGWADDGAASTSCTNYFTSALDSDDLLYELKVGGSASMDFTGILFTPTSAIDVCSLDVYVDAVTIGGSSYTTAAAQNAASPSRLPTTKDYYCRIFTVSQTTPSVATGTLGTSNSFPGDELVAQSYHTGVSFATPVSLSSGTTYGIGCFVSTDTNLSDDPEEDVNNYFSMGFANESSESDQAGGRCVWTYAASYNYAVYGEDANDDTLMKIDTDQ